MDQFWVSLGVNIALGAVQTYFAYGQFKMMKAQTPAGYRGSSTQTTRFFVMLTVTVALAALAWVPYFWPYDDLPDWPAGNSYVRHYGQHPEQLMCNLTVDGNRFWKYHSRYRLASGCYLDDGSVDPLDAPELQVSKMYDIQKGDMMMMANWKPTFFDYLKQKRARGLAHVVFMIPEGVSPDQFTTLRQARAFGVRLVPAGTSIGYREVVPMPLPAIQ